MVAYTAGMVSRYGSTNGATTRIATLVQHTNSAYTNSEVAITLNLVHTVQVSHPDSGSNDGTRLNGLTNGTGTGLSNLASLRNTHGADIVALVRSFESTHGGCGIAWIGGSGVTNIADDDAFGYALVSDGSYQSGNSTVFCTLGTFAHELGHNMGLVHDRANANGAGATLYAYGYTIPSTNIGDTMSYAQQEAVAFSSPSVRCNTSGSPLVCSTNASGSALGVAANTPTESCISSASGCNANQASGCSSNPSTCADAARALNFTRVKVSQWRTAAATPPSISGTATLSSGGNAFEGTTLCANPSAGVSCTSTSNGNYSCTVPNGWTGTLHLQAGNGSRVAAKRFTAGITSAQSGQNFVVSSSTSPACNLDIDNNGLNEAAIDGVMILRKLMGVTGNDQAVSASGACAQRTSVADKATYLSGRSYDINGNVDTVARPLRDGLILLRLMLGIPGETAVTGTGLTWVSVQSNINSQCGTGF
jgi:hypothetical protein